ncbi:DUF2169 family type VI secretion system accessory protein [Myxococcus xanthus]|uniref:DUF2169 domain-containing protein n=1 Tax=Myxococcus xanthus TaxID=34 RepID=A0A7Y4MUE6_MYXXA|nr:DUF2169 domain-containing protein [Myxococcus xanthus]NOJ82542.1 DUF2169 domain-containing protein [Myxococcus xanthus]NOJ89973.1 DUF2169 domain-containing protein [Myxococcus xanthus]
MPIIENTTAFTARDFLSMDKDGADTLVICLCGSFKLTAPGKAGPEGLSLADEQPAPPSEDVYWGDPGISSLRYEGQSAYFRPGTDIYVNGQAWAPHGRPVKEHLVAVRVGECQKGLRVFGDRVWWRGITGWRSTSPEPFTSMPLRYERSFGGPASLGASKPHGVYEDRNPLGRGFHPEGRDADNQPLPNLEDPLQPLDLPTKRVPPAGLGAISR